MTGNVNGSVKNVDPRDRKHLDHYQKKVYSAHKNLEIALDPRIRETTCGMMARLHNTDKWRVQKVRTRMGIKGHQRKKYRGPASPLSEELSRWGR